VIVGLGNPGQRYQANRHNIGYRVVEELARRSDLTFARSPARYLATSESPAPGELVLIKPLTYMNLSGEALTAWSAVSGVAVTGRTQPSRDSISSQESMESVQPVDPAPVNAVRPLVVCDDLALPLGAIRLRARGSCGGQNGLASIIEAVDGEEFPRLRLGIAGGEEPLDPATWPDYVLADFSVQEESVVQETVAMACEALEYWLEQGLEQTASRFNRRRPPAGEDE